MAEERSLCPSAQSAPAVLPPPEGGGAEEGSAEAAPPVAVRPAAVAASASPVRSCLEPLARPRLRSSRANRDSAEPEPEPAPESERGRGTRQHHTQTLSLSLSLSRSPRRSLSEDGTHGNITRAAVSPLAHPRGQTRLVQPGDAERVSRYKAGVVRLGPRQNSPAESSSRARQPTRRLLVLKGSAARGRVRSRAVYPGGVYPGAGLEGPGERSATRGPEYADGTPGPRAEAARALIVWSPQAKGPNRGLDNERGSAGQRGWARGAMPPVDWLLRGRF